MNKTKQKKLYIISIDNLHISYNVSSMEANIRVLLIRNSSSHSSFIGCQQLGALA